MAKLKILLLTIIPCVILAGCGSFGKDISVDKTGITEYYKALSGTKMQVGISADFPERVSKYRVSYTYSKDAESTIEILEPKEVSGVRISINNASTELEFDGARLETGKLDAGGLTPLNALPGLMSEWSKGEINQIEAVTRDGVSCALMVYSNEQDGEKREYRTWFDRSNYYPVYAEILVDGRCVIRCEYETVSPN